MKNVLVVPNCTELSPITINEGKAENRSSILIKFLKVYPMMVSGASSYLFDKIS